MITHVMFEALDAEFPATLSPRIVNELLRRRPWLRGRNMHRLHGNESDH